MKHLILTGKNVSGKTSVAEALAEYLNNVLSNQYLDYKDKEETLESSRKCLDIRFN